MPSGPTRSIGTDGVNRQIVGAVAYRHERPYGQVGRMGDLVRTGTYRMTDVWVHVPEGWRLQARHAQPLDTP